MCSRKVVVKPLIFRLFRTLPVSQGLRFLCLIIMACETSGIKLQGPSLCIRTHGWSQHRLGPCSFIPVGDSRHDALNRKLLQHLPQFLIHHSRICLSFHGFHSLSDQCAECFFFAAFVIGNGFWILRNDFF